MQLSRDVGEPISKSFESCLKPVPDKNGMYAAYRCPAGVPTIGWGTTSENGHPVVMGMVWTRAECDAAFTVDAKKFAEHVTKQLGAAAVTQDQFDALWDWSYNTGGPASSSIWPAARRGDVDAVCTTLARWNKAKGKVLPGLTRRRNADAALYRGDRKAAARFAQIHLASGEEMAQLVDTPTPSLADAAKRSKVGSALVAGGPAMSAAAGGTAAIQSPSDAPQQAAPTIPQPGPSGAVPPGPVDTTKLQGITWPDAPAPLPTVNIGAVGITVLAAVLLAGIGLLVIRRKQRLLAIDWA